MSKNPKNRWRVNIDGENLPIFWTTWGILITFSGKIWLMIILKKQKQKKQGLILSLKNTILEKPEGKCQTEHPSLLRVKTLI